MKTVLIAEFKQETNTFVPGKTTMEDFRSRNLLEGEEILTYFQGYKNEMGAFLEVLSSRRDIRIIPSIAANAQPGPMVHRDVYDYVRARLLQDIKKSGKLDGILLSFHGAMVVDGIEDPEGTLLEDIRRQVGGSLPLCLSLDFHANITRKMAQNATLMFPFRYYPHIDMYEAGLNAARAILGILDGTILPVMRVIKLPILCPLVPTDEEPFARFIEKAVSFEQVEDVLSAAIVAGFPYADIREGGMSVIVQTNNNAGRAEAMAQSLARTVWEAREELKPDSKPVAAAVTEALATPGVTVLADVVDNPGAGSPGDATEIIHELIRQKAQNVIVATIYDPEVVKQAVQAGPGTTIEICMGGKSHPAVGAPVQTKAYVKSLSDGVFTNKGVMSRGVVNHLGTTAVLQLDGITVLVTSNRFQPWDPEIFRAHGIEPTEAAIIVLKSSIHYRAAFGQFAAKMIAVDAPNLWSLDLLKLGIKNCSRPVYPLDRDCPAPGQL